MTSSGGFNLVVKMPNQDMHIEDVTSLCPDSAGLKIQSQSEIMRKAAETPQNRTKKLVSFVNMA